MGSVQRDKQTNCSVCGLSILVSRVRSNNTCGECQQQRAVHYRARNRERLLEYGVQKTRKRCEELGLPYHWSTKDRRDSRVVDKVKWCIAYLEEYGYKVTQKDIGWDKKK